MSVYFVVVRWDYLSMCISQERKSVTKLFFKFSINLLNCFTIIKGCIRSPLSSISFASCISGFYSWYTFFFFLIHVFNCYIFSLTFIIIKISLISIVLFLFFADTINILQLCDIYCLHGILFSILSL